MLQIARGQSISNYSVLRCLSLANYCYNSARSKWRSKNARKSYAHQRKTSGASSDPPHLRPFSKWELLLKERICSQRERTSLKGKNLLPEGAN